MSTHKGQSGSEKRKLAAAKKASDAAMLSKMPLLVQIFAPSQTSARGESQSQSPEQSDISEFMHTDLTVEPFPEHPTGSSPVAEAESCTDINQYVNDIGLWEKINEPMREYWAVRSSSQCQNADANFNQSSVVFRTESLPAAVLPRILPEFTHLSGLKFNALGCVIRYRIKCYFAFLASCSVIQIMIIVYLLPFLVTGERVKQRLLLMRTPKSTVPRL